MAQEAPGYRDVRDLFEAGDGPGLDGLPRDYAAALNRGHGRTERRECRAADGAVFLEYLSSAGARAAPGGEGGAPPGDGGWRCGAGRMLHQQPGGTGTASACGSARAPEHRDSFRWSLDVTFREDWDRVRKGHGPRNMATPRQVSRNLLKRETSLKTGIRGKRLQAGWREGCLLKVLTG